MLLIHDYMHLIYCVHDRKETLLTGWVRMSSGEETWVLKSFRLDLLGLLFSEAFGSSGDLTFTMLMIFLAEEDVKGLLAESSNQYHWLRVKLRARADLCFQRGLESSGWSHQSFGGLHPFYLSGWQESLSALIDSPFFLAQWESGKEQKKNSTQDRCKMSQVNRINRKI